MGTDTDKLNEDITRIGPPGDVQIFTLPEARNMLPLVVRITHNSVNELEPIQKRLRRMLSCDPRLSEVEQRYEATVRSWIGKIERLGLVACGLWWIDIDMGEGYVCWRYPEIRLDYFHDYEEKPADRKRISELYEEFSPDWIH